MLNRRRPEGKELTIEQAMKRLTTVTVDDLVIDPLYTRRRRARRRHDLATRARDAVHPGHVAAHRRHPRVGHHPACTRIPTSRSPTPPCSPTWPRAPRRCGCGSIRTPSPPPIWPACWPACMPELARLRVTSRTDQLAAAKALADFWRASGQSATVGGNLGIDALGHAALTGEAPEFGPQREWVATALARVPQGAGHRGRHPPYDDAGAGDVDVLAFAHRHRRRVPARPGSRPASPAEQAFAQIAFRVPANADQFLTIARLRALRRLWARVGEVSGVPAGKRGADPARRHARGG